jgi:hypothetical protein
MVPAVLRQGRLRAVGAMGIKFARHQDLDAPDTMEEDRNSQQKNLNHRQIGEVMDGVDAIDKSLRVIAEQQRCLRINKQMLDQKKNEP